MGKDVGLRIRLERALRDEFLEACRAQDRPAAQVLREFMRGFVAENSKVLDDNLEARIEDKSNIENL